MLDCIFTDYDQREERVRVRGKLDLKIWIPARLASRRRITRFLEGGLV